MKQQEVFKKIGALIQDLNEQYEYLLTAGDPMNEVEIELFVANAHFVTEHAEILRKLNAQSINAAKLQKPTEPAPKQEPEQQERYFEPLVRQVNAPPIAQAEVKQTATELPQPVVSKVEDKEEEVVKPVAEPQEEPAIIRHELTLDDLGDWDEDELDDDESIAEATPAVAQQPIPASPVTAKPAPVVEMTTPEAVIEKIKDEQAETPMITFNQKISATLNATTRLSDSLTGQPVKDLKSAISLNEKLLFIKDLFNGYSLAYSEAIELINRFNSFEEADQFLRSNYAAKNKWDEKTGTTDKFYALLRRRFPAV